MTSLLILALFTGALESPTSGPTSEPFSYRIQQEDAEIIALFGVLGLLCFTFVYTASKSGLLGEDR